MDQQLAPLIVGAGLGQRHILQTHGHGCPGLQAAAVQRGENGKTGIHVEGDQLTGIYNNLARSIVALVSRCKPAGGTERTSSESTAEPWLNPNEVSHRMSGVFTVRLSDALAGNGLPRPQPRRKHLIPAG